MTVARTIRARGTSLALLLALGAFALLLALPAIAGAQDPTSTEAAPTTTEEAAPTTTEDTAPPGSDESGGTSDEPNPQPPQEETDQGNGTGTSTDRGNTGTGTGTGTGTDSGSTPPAASEPARLANTGSETWAILGGGVLLVGLGTGIALRRRQHA